MSTPPPPVPPTTHPSMARLSRRRYSPHVHPTERDRAVFTYIAQLGVASAEQIHRGFWPQAKLQTCKDRLAQLVHGGFLHTTVTNARRQVEEIYWIERKAALLFSETERQQQTRGIPAQAELAHMLHTRDILDRLTASGQLVSFRSEHQLKSEKARARGHGRRLQIADGEVTMRDHAGHERAFLLEVDGAYYGQRLRTKVADLAQAQRSVLWVVYSARRLATVRAATAAFPHIHVTRFPSL